MRARLRPRLTYANVVATLCLFVVLGGGAFAAVTSFVQTNGTIRGCVSRKGQLTVLKKGATKCKKGLSAISWSKGAPTGPAGGDLTGNYPAPTIKQNAVNGANVDESTLGEVPNARDASKLNGMPPEAYFSSSNIARIDRSLTQFNPGEALANVLDLGGLHLDLECAFDSGTTQQTITFTGLSPGPNARVTWEFVHGSTAVQGEAALSGSTNQVLFQRSVPSGSEVGAGTFVYRDDAQTIAIPFRYSVTHDTGVCEVGGVATRSA